MAKNASLVSLEVSMTLGAERQTALSDCSWTYILDNPLLFNAILMTVDQQAHQAVLDSAFSCDETDGYKTTVAVKTCLTKLISD